MLTGFWRELSLRWSRQWIAGRLAWWTWLACVVLACTGALAAHELAQLAGHRAADRGLRLAALKATYLTREQGAQSVDPALGHDFVHQLSTSSELDILGQLNEAAAKHGAHPIGVSVQRTVPSESTFGELLIQGSLRGNYRQTKAVLAALLNANPHALLHQVRWSQVRAGEAEAEFRLGFLEPPRSSNRRVDEK